MTFFKNDRPLVGPPLTTRDDDEHCTSGMMFEATVFVIILFIYITIIIALPPTGSRRQTVDGSPGSG